MIVILVIFFVIITFEVAVISIFAFVCRIAVVSGVPVARLGRRSSRRGRVIVIVFIL